MQNNFFILTISCFFLKESRTPVRFFYALKPIFLDGITSLLSFIKIIYKKIEILLYKYK